MTDPPKLRNSHQQGVKKTSGSAIKLATRLSATAQMNGAESDDQSDELSEGEITSSVTISALLSKLDSVRVNNSSLLRVVVLYIVLVHCRYVLMVYHQLHCP